MNTNDEIPLEEHRYFAARLAHLERRHPVALLSYLTDRNLTSHLREVTAQAMLVLAEMILVRGLPQDQADELVMHQIVADPLEKSRLHGASTRRRMRDMLKSYKDSLPNLPRTYLSQIEITG